MAFHPKVKAAGAGGVAAVLLVYVAGLFGVSLPPEVASAVAALVAFAAGYLKSA